MRGVDNIGGRGAGLGESEDGLIFEYVFEGGRGGERRGFSSLGDHCCLFCLKEGEGEGKEGEEKVG